MELKELLTKIENGEELYKHNAISRATIEVIMRGGDKITLIGGLLNVINENQNKLIELCTNVPVINVIKPDESFNMMVDVLKKVKKMMLKNGITVENADIYNLVDSHIPK